MHFLISDFDATMSGAPLGDQSSTHKLTPCVIHFARNVEPTIDGFFCATARSYHSYVTNLADYAREDELNQQVLGRKILVHFQGRFTRNCDLYLFMSGFLSHSIRNFSAITNIPLLGVATASDVEISDCENCGDAYAKYILPYEKAILESIDLNNMRVNVPAITRVSKNRTVNDKKELLRNVAKRAIEIHGNVPMTFSFLDDTRRHCIDALEVWKEFPNITAKVYLVSRYGIHQVNPGQALHVYRNDLSFFNERSLTTRRLIAGKLSSENNYSTTVRMDFLKELCAILVKNYYQNELPFIQQILDGVENTCRRYPDKELLPKLKEFIDQSFPASELASKEYLFACLDRLQERINDEEQNEIEAKKITFNVF